MPSWPPAADSLGEGPVPADGWTERVRVVLARRLFSSLAGMSAGDWLGAVADNGFAVDPIYLPRALLLTFASGPTALDRWLEDRRFGAALDAVTVPPPLFVLGHWRTGTTHLHNLLAADRRFAAPNLFQAFNPHTFLRNEAWLGRYVAPMVPRRRLMDDVRLGPDAPQEDEFALAAATGLSPYLGWVFPRRRAAYDRYLTFRNATAAEVGRWKAALLRFARKLTLRHGRPLVLKSPPHTARVRMLLDSFPDARFVHVRRDPYAVFQSTRHFERAAASSLAVQRPPREDADARILARYAELYDAYLVDSPLIPPGRLHEMRYEGLRADPLGELGRLYAGLGLPDFDSARPAVEKHLQDVAGYRANRFRPLREPDRRRVAAAWGRYFAAFGYAP